MTSPVTILLLDAEPMLLRATALLLSNRGGSVTTAATPAEAVALAAARLYDVAILDIAPDGPGAPEVLAQVRAGGLVPRRVIAVCDAPIDPRAAAGIGAILQKPYPFDQLLHAVFGAEGRRARTGASPRARAVPSAARAAASARLSPRGPRRRAARASRGPG